MWELDHKEGWMPKNRCFQKVVLEKTLESPLDSKQIKLVNPKENQPWIYIAKTDPETEAPILWPSDAKSRLTGKDPDAGKDWRQEEKGVTEGKMVGWHHRLIGHEFEQTLGHSEGWGAWNVALHRDTNSFTRLSYWTIICRHVHRDPRKEHNEATVMRGCQMNFKRYSLLESDLKLIQIAGYLPLLFSEGEALPVCDRCQGVECTWCLPFVSVCSVLYLS